MNYGMRFMTLHWRKMATVSESWAEDVQSGLSLPTPPGRRARRRPGLGSGALQRDGDLPPRGPGATWRGKPLRACGIPQAAAPSTPLASGRVSRCHLRNASGTVLRLPSTAPFVITPSLGQEFPLISIILFSDYVNLILSQFFFLKPSPSIADFFSTIWRNQADVKLLRQRLAPYLEIDSS